MQGPLTFSTVPAYLEQAARLSRAGELDLSGVTQMDSAGLSLLLELKRRAQLEGVVLGFTQVPTPVKRLADHFGISGILEIKT